LLNLFLLSISYKILRALSYFLFSLLTTVLDFYNG
jgi:hypothetical protein